VMGLPGFEPGSREPKSQNDLANEGIDWSGFEKWLKNRLRRYYANKVRNYAQRYGFVLFEPEKISVISGFSRDKLRNVMAALANLAKYLGMYQSWQVIKTQAGLKWKQQSQMEVFLSMMKTDLSDVKNWLLQAIEKLPRKYSCILVFDAVTGLRPDEACKSVSLITELAGAGRLNDYFNEQLQMLEHFRHPNLFLRGCKNCYISFVPGQVFELIMEAKPKVRDYALRDALHKRGLSGEIMGLRKLYATTLRDKGMPQEIVDLLEGRIGQSIFLRHYYKPDLLKETREKVLKAIQPLVDEVLAT